MKCPVAVGGADCLIAPLFGCAVVLIVSFTSFLFAHEPAVWRDPSPHRLQFVSVEPNVRLEVLDWGGSGRPLILLNGLGGTLTASTTSRRSLRT